MADEFDAETFLAEFADEYRRYPNLRARTLAIFAGRLKLHLADRGAVAGLRDRLVATALRIGVDGRACWCDPVAIRGDGSQSHKPNCNANRAALAAAGEGD